MTWATLREILPPPQRVLGFMCWRGKCCAFFIGVLAPDDAWQKTLFFLGSVFVIHFRERTFVFVVLMPPCVFRGVLPMFLHVCWAFCSRKCPAKILFFLGLVFEIHFRHFRERTFVFVVLMPPCVFQWCFVYVIAYLLGFLFPKMLGKNSLLLRFGFWDPFSGANFCSCCLVAALCFSVVFCLCFCIFVGFSVPENAWQKFSSS